MPSSRCTCINLLISAVITAGSRNIDENRWMRVPDDAANRHHGSAGIYGVIDKRDIEVLAQIDGGSVDLVLRCRVWCRVKQSSTNSWIE